jgi:hypothetical protein
MQNTLHLLALAALAGASALAQAQMPAAPTPADDEPEIASYSISTTLKFSSDRKTRGISDTFGRPGAELTVELAHESGMIGQFQVGSISRVNYPDSNRLNPMLAVGWRGGDPRALHYGVAAAREWFPRARVTGAPTGFDENFDPTGVANTGFHTSYLVGELGWGYLTARYLHVVSRDFRGANTSTICPSYLASDMAAAMDCYGQGMRHSRGTQLLDLDLAYPINGSTKLIGHLGWQKVRNFRGMDTVDYRLGLEHTRWGFIFGAEAAGATVRDSAPFVAVDAGGTARRMDKTRLILSIAKRF